MFSNMFWNTVIDKLEAVVSSMQLISDVKLGHPSAVPSQIYQENLQISILV